MDTQTDSNGAVRKQGGLGPLDFLKMLAERFWLLLLVPMIGLGLALVAAAYSRKIYTSVAYVAVSDETAKQFKAFSNMPAVLDAVLFKYPENVKSQDIARQALVRKIRISDRMEGGKRVGGLTVVEVDADDPKRAQATNSLLIDTFLDLLRPRENQKKDLEQQLERSEEQYRAVSELSNRLEQEATKLLMPNTMNGEIATAMTSLLAQRDKHADMTAKTKIMLRGPNRDVVISPPTLPTEPSWPNNGMFVKIGAGLGFALAAAIALLGGVMTRLDARTKERVRGIATRISFASKKKSADS